MSEEILIAIRDELVRIGNVLDDIRGEMPDAAVEWEEVSVGPNCSLLVQIEALSENGYHIHTILYEGTRHRIIAWRGEQG